MPKYMHSSIAHAAIIGGVLYLDPSEFTWLYNSEFGRSYTDINPPAQSGWQTRTYAYDANHPHAVSSLTSGQSSVGSYQYDSNGNMTCRTEEGVAYIQTYNTENRISSIIKLASPSGTCAAPGLFAAKWDFAYDGDGVRVSTLLTPYDETGTPLTPEMTSYFFGGAYETRSDPSTGSGQATTNIKYYSFAGQTIGMDDGTGLQYFLTDHLGSVVATTDSTGTLISQQRYLPFGGVRPNVPTPSGPSTDYGYTGQRNLDSDIGLMDYKARFYSAYLNRFVQPDSLIPNPSNPQAFNRYTYVMNSPVNFNDPTGHMCSDPDDETGSCEGSTGHIKTKVGNKMLSGNGKSGGGSCGGFGQKACRRSFTLEKGAKGGAGENGESSEPVDNVQLPLAEWDACTSDLYITKTCAYGSSSLKLEFSDFDITTSPNELHLADISISRYGDMKYSIEAFSNFYGGSELSAGFGVSLSSLNSLKVSAEMSATLHEENASGNFTTGISHEYRPKNQLIAQGIWNAAGIIYILFGPYRGTEVIRRLTPLVLQRDFTVLRDFGLYYETLRLQRFEL